MRDAECNDVSEPRPNDPKAQARAAEPNQPDATTGDPVTRHENVAGRMSPAAQSLGCSGSPPPVPFEPMRQLPHREL